MHVREGEHARDRRLVERHQAGDDADAFVELYRLHYARLVRLCARWLGSDAHLAEDIAQEAFVRALRGLDSFGGERLFFPWLAVIARRLVAMHFRRAWRRAAAYERAGAGAAVWTSGHEDAVIDWVADAGVRARALEALERVPKRYQEVIRLRECEQLSYAEIAVRMEITHAAVAPLLHRARASLRREFEGLAPRDVKGALLGPLGALAAGLRRARARGMQWASALPDVGVVGVPVAAGLMSLGSVIFTPAVTDALLEDGRLGAAATAGAFRQVVPADDGSTSTPTDSGEAGVVRGSASDPPLRLASNNTRIGQGLVDNDRLRNGAASVTTGEAQRRDRARSRDMPHGQQIGPLWWRMDPGEAQRAVADLAPGAR